MIHKTRGIVLRTTDYSDTSIITRIYTEEFGTQSYLIKGARRKKANVKGNLFQPLSLLDLVVYKKERNSLQTLKEAGPAVHLNSIPSDPVKTSLLLFINEVLARCVQEEESNTELFSFIYDTVLTLEGAEKDFTNLHLIFMVRLSRFLGFYPQGNFSEATPLFDLREGRFVTEEPLHAEYLSGESSRLLSRIILSSYYSMGGLQVSGKERKELLDILLHFYHLHLVNFSGITSHKVLEQVFA